MRTFETAVPAGQRAASLQEQRSQVLAAAEMVRANAVGRELSASERTVLARLERDAELLDDRARRFARVEPERRAVFAKGRGRAGSGLLAPAGAPARQESAKRDLNERTI